MTEGAERTLLPGVSVLTTTYNRADVLGRAIDSVLAQDTPDWELVIVDNASTDGTQELLARYQDDRIKVIRIEPNRGCVGGRNVCLDHASREWFTFLDSDDQLVPHALSTLLAVPEALGQDLDQVMCNCISSRTGAFTGSGLDDDQWVDYPTMVAVCHGEHNAITKTSLVGAHRFNEKIQKESVFWYRLDRAARRYYIHQGLKIRSTGRSDTETTRQRTNLASRYPEFVALLDEESWYLDELAALAARDWSALLFTACNVFLVAGDRQRARSAYRALRDKGLPKHRLVAWLGVTLGPDAIDMLRRSRDVASRLLPASSFRSRK